MVWLCRLWFEDKGVGRDGRLGYCSLARVLTVVSRSPKITNCYRRRFLLPRRDLGLLDLHTVLSLYEVAQLRMQEPSRLVHGAGVRHLDTRTCSELTSFHCSVELVKLSVPVVASLD